MLKQLHTYQVPVKSQHTVHHSKKTPQNKVQELLTLYTLSCLLFCQILSNPNLLFPAEDWQVQVLNIS